MSRQPHRDTINLLSATSVETVKADEYEIEDEAELFLPTLT